MGVGSIQCVRYLYLLNNILLYLLEEREEMLKNRSQGLNSTSKKKKRLHELFLPPMDILHPGDFQSVSLQCCSFKE